MSLASNIKDVLKFISLNAPDPKQDHPWHLSHLHADFFELKCLLWDRNSVLTIQDVISHYKDHNIDVGVDKSPLLEDVATNETSEINDEWQSKMISIFGVLEEREVIYDEDYPFILKSSTSLQLKNELSLRHKLYLILLILSNLNNFSKLQWKLTSEFETISKNLLEDLFPKARVEEFGQNSAFKGNTEKKIKELSKIIKVDTRPDYLKLLSKHANKEKGLDIVGWSAFRDEVANMLIFLGQCACGKDWPGKRSETETYESYLDFVRIKPIHAMFVPYGLVHYDNIFYQGEQTNQSLFIERKRFLDISDEKLSAIAHMDSFKIIDELLKSDNVEV